MTNEQIENMIKRACENQATSQGLCGSIGSSAQSLRERIEGQAQSAEYQGMKAARLRELSALLEKNPEVSRILELMSEVRD